VLALVEEGHYISSLVGRRSVIDENFLGIKNVDIIYNEVEDIFTLESEVKALSLLKKYKVDYIYFSYRARNKYDKEKLNYVDDKKCFRQVKSIERGAIYRVTC